MSKRTTNARAVEKYDANTLKSIKAGLFAAKPKKREKKTIRTIVGDAYEQIEDALKRKVSWEDITAVLNEKLGAKFSKSTISGTFKMLRKERTPKPAAKSDDMKIKVDNIKLNIS